MTRSKARATAAKDAKGRAIYRGAQGGHFIMKNGKRRYMTPERLQAAQRALAEQLARKVTGNAVVALGAAAAMKGARRAGPKGLGLRSNLYALNATEENGYARDPVHLNRIPKTRAVKVGKQTFDTKTLRKLFHLNPNATHPVSRQPFPPNIRAKYGPRVPQPNPNPAGAPTGPPGEQQFIRRVSAIRRAFRLGYGPSQLPAAAAVLWRACLAILYVLCGGRIRYNSNAAYEAYDNDIQTRYGVEILVRTVLWPQPQFEVSLQNLFAGIEIADDDDFIYIHMYKYDSRNRHIIHPVFHAQIHRLEIEDALGTTVPWDNLFLPRHV